MYKINTNQTDLPLSQLQIRSSKSPILPHNQLSTRRPLPSSRLQPSQLHAYREIPRSNASHTRPSISNTSCNSSSPPPQYISDPNTELSPSRRDEAAYHNVATPILPRSRDGFLHPNGPESPRDVTSSVVKGRAADGLLSLMGGGPRMQN